MTKLKGLGRTLPSTRFFAIAVCLLVVATVGLSALQPAKDSSHQEETVSLSEAERKAVVAARGPGLYQRAQTLDRRAESVAQHLEVLDRRAEALNHRSSELDQRAEALSRRGDLLDGRGTALTQRRSALADRRDLLSNREALLDERVGNSNAYPD